MIRITNSKLWCFPSLATIIQYEKDGVLAMLDRSTPNIVHLNNSDFENYK